MEPRLWFSSRDVRIPKNYFTWDSPSNAARMVIHNLFKKAFGMLPPLVYQIMFIDRMFARQAIAIDEKFNQSPQDQILNEIKYPYICNYGYHIYPKWRHIHPKPGMECRSMTYHILFGRGAGRRNSVSELLGSLSFIQRNTIYGCGIDSYPKESIPQIKPEKRHMKYIYIELADSRRCMISQKFLKEVDIDADNS